MMYMGMAWHKFQVGECGGERMDWGVTHVVVKLNYATVLSNNSASILAWYLLENYLQLISIMT